MRFFAFVGVVVVTTFTLMWVGSIAGHIPGWAVVVAGLFLVLLWLRWKRGPVESTYLPGDALYSPTRTARRD